MSKFLDTYLGLVKKFIPSPADIPSIGLDIGSGECKLVEISKTANGFELLNWAIEPVINADVGAAIKKILSQTKLPSTNPHTAIFGKGTLIRYINMPRMTLPELKNALAIEADKYFPFAKEQIYTDCMVIDNSPDKRDVAVLVAAVKKEMVDQRAKMLQSLGLNIDFIGLNPIALANVINVLGHPEINDIKTGVAVFDMGDSLSNLTIMINRMPRFTRDIYLGGKEITRRLSNAMGISIEDAEKLKIQPGDKLSEVVSASETAIMNIVQELRLSFDYFATEKNCEISKMLLTGGGAMLEGVSAIFEKNLDIKVSLWNPLEPLKFSQDLVAEEINKKALKLGVALGLALYQYAGN